MKWSEKTWQAAQPVYNQILELPFIQELMNGVLPREKFLFYIQQDAIYLSEFGKTLAGIVARLQNKSHIEAFISFAGDTVAVEGSLHESFLQTMEKPVTKKPSPSCLLYTCYMRKQLSATSVEEAVATVLPCFWVYKEVGNYILKHQTRSENPYQEWINTYGGEDFEKAVNLAISICNELAANCTERQQQAMTETFVLAVKMEWMFWNSAWNLEQWPV